MRVARRERMVVWSIMRGVVVVVGIVGGGWSLCWIKIAGLASDTGLGKAVNVKADAPAS